MPARRAVPLTQSRVSVPREAGTGVGTSAGCPRGPPRPGPRQAAALRAGSASRAPARPLRPGDGWERAPDFQPRRGPLGHVPPHPAGPRPGSHSLVAPAARARAPRPLALQPRGDGRALPHLETLPGGSGAGAAARPLPAPRQLTQLYPPGQGWKA